MLIDGISEPDDINGRADWLGASAGESAAFATADLTQAYSYVWKNQFIYYDADTRVARIQWSDQEDTMHFGAPGAHPTGVRVVRDGKTVGGKAEGQQ